MNLIAFDLEGPLSPNDHAYELMSLAPNGSKVFEVISRYDDLLTLEGREGYEPGDTLSLIVPFLLYYGIKEEDIKALANKASLTPGAKELIEMLKSQGWRILCITTTYEPYALTLTSRLGIKKEEVASTPFPIDKIREGIDPQEIRMIGEIEKEILSFKEEGEMKRRLDHFFWKELPPSLTQALKMVKPIGGKRKIEALLRLAEGIPLSQIAVVGDSITDFKMLKLVDENGGLAIAFNANEYALPYATLGLASANILDLWLALKAWQEGGRERVKEIVKEKKGEGDRGYFHWLKEGELPFEIHKKIRRLLRHKAAELG